MFLIVNDTKILRCDGERVTIGSSLSADILLSGSGVQASHAEVLRNDKGWCIMSHAGRGTFANGASIPEGVLTPLTQPCEIRIGNNVILSREASVNGAISRTLRAKTFELETRLHRNILDRLRTLTAEDSAADQKHVERELERQFLGLTLDAELESYLASQELLQLLLNRVHGYGDVQTAIMTPRRATALHFDPLVGDLERKIGLADDRTAAEKTERIEALLPWALQVQRSTIVTSDRRTLAIALLRDQLSDLMFGLGPLQDLLRAEDINDIMVLPSGHIFVERGGRMQDSGRKMLSPDVSRRIIQRIISEQGRRIDQTSPMVDARVSDGSRLNAIIEPLAVDGPALTIRRFAEKSFTIHDLVENGTLTSNAANFLTSCVLARKSIVVCGGTGSGKTTLLNALASFIPSEERIVTVEDTAEMKISQTHVVRLQAKTANLEGKGAISIRQLVRNTLRMRPDRIIVGECRGGEALDMLQAMNTGHSGSMTTIHANSPQDGMRRLEVMSMEAEGIDLPSRALREQIVSALDLVIQISRTAHRARRVTSICEVVDIDEDRGNVILEEIYSYRRKKTTGPFSSSSLAFTGYVPTYFDELLANGAELTCLE